MIKKINKILLFALQFSLYYWYGQSVTVAVLWSKKWHKNHHHHCLILNRKPLLIGGKKNQTVWIQVLRRNIDPLSTNTSFSQCEPSWEHLRTVAALFLFNCLLVYYLCIMQAWSSLCFELEVPRGDRETETTFQWAQSTTNCLFFSLPFACRSHLDHCRKSLRAERLWTALFFEVNLLANIGKGRKITGVSSPKILGVTETKKDQLFIGCQKMTRLASDL